MRRTFVVLMLAMTLGVGSFMLCGCEYVIGKVYLDRRTRAQIYLTENEHDISGCDFIKHVKSSSRWGGLLLQNEALESVISDLTHESAQAGANVLLIRKKSKSMMGSSASGDAYLCKEVKFTSPIPSPSASTPSQKPIVSPETQAAPTSKPPPTSNDIVEKLTKLKQLKDSGILTEEEYIEKRKGLVDKL